MGTYGFKKNQIILSSLILLGLLTGCSRGNIRYDTKESTKALLPEIVQYSREKQTGAAKEIKNGYCPILTEFTQDSAQLRDRLRLIKKELE